MAFAYSSSRWDIVCNMMRTHFMTHKPYDWLTKIKSDDEIGRTNPVVQPCNSHMISLNLPTLQIIQWPLIKFLIFFVGEKYNNICIFYIQSKQLCLVHIYRPITQPGGICIRLQTISLSTTIHMYAIDYRPFGICIQLCL